MTFIDFSQLIHESFWIIQAIYAKQFNIQQPWFIHDKIEASILNYNISSKVENMESNPSTLSDQPKFHLKSSAVSGTDMTLTSAIKKGNVKSFIRKSSLTNSSCILEDQQNNGLEGHLLQLKNSCSGLSQEIKKKQTETFKFRDETTFTLEKSNKLKEERQKLEDKLQQLSRSFDQVNAKRDVASHSSKTYEHILQRMKKDNIHNQLKKNQLMRELRSLDKNFNLAETKQYNLTEMEKLSYFGVKDAHQQLQEQNLSRKNKLSQIEEQTMKKKDLTEKLKKRQNQTDQIQQMAAGDLQDADLVRLKKFLTVQVFLKELLKSKISRLKSYFEPYEIAFYHIKSRTHVKDSNALKNQFFNFENSYTEKTEWVKILENELTQAQAEKEKLRLKLKDLCNHEIEILEEVENRTEVEDAKIDRRQFSEKSFQYELAWQRVQSWLKIQMKKMNLNIKAPSDKVNSQEILKTICSKLHKKSEKINESQQKETLSDEASKETPAAPEQINSQKTNEASQEESLELLQKQIS